MSNCSTEPNERPPRMLDVRFLYRYLQTAAAQTANRFISRSKQEVVCLSMLLLLPLLGNAVGCGYGAIEDLHEQASVAGTGDLETAVGRFREIHQMLTGDPDSSIGESPDETADAAEGAPDSDDSASHDDANHDDAKEEAPRLAELVAELAQIAKRLPKLAADTRLEEEAWVEISEYGRRVEAIVAPLAEVDEADLLESYQGIASEVEQRLVKIEEIVATIDQIVEPWERR